MDQLNVCLTGIPRSGTTLTCNLLNKLPDTVALHEPMKANTFYKYGGVERLCEAIADFFEKTRASIEQENKIISKPSRLGKGGQREMTLKKQVTPPFILCIKHPAAFTAILADLGKRFRCYAIVRNPLAVLASWNRVDMPVQDGHSPAAEKLDRRLAERLAELDDKFERQLALLAWYYDQYRRFLPKSNIIFYENIISSSGRCLEVIAASAGALDKTMRNRNMKKKYDLEILQFLADKLTKTSSANWEFYAKTDVDALLNECLSAITESGQTETNT